jgi:hypothetical protein
VSGLQILNALPLWALATIVIGVSVVFAVGLQLLVRWRYGVEFIVANHEVAGFKYAVVGVAKLINGLGRMASEDSVRQKIP